MRYLRIKKNTDFQKMFRKGKRVYSPCLTLLYTVSPEMKMGIALSKKHGNAVKRNRIKRLVRAAFYDTNAKAADNYSVIVLPKIAEDYTYDGFVKSFISCYKRMDK